jgi:hypothetical protein
MRPLFLSLCWLISFHIAFSQSSPVKSSTPSSEEIEDTTIVVLCSSSSGKPGVLVKNGKGQTEFISNDQFAKSKASAQSKSILPGTVNKKAIASAVPSAKTKSSEAVVTGQSTRSDSGAPDKLPPVLSQGPPSH